MSDLWVSLHAIACGGELKVEGWGGACAKCGATFTIKRLNVRLLSEAEVKP